MSGVIEMSMTVCVTGATGYVAGHVVRELLERGFTVHATARDPSIKAKTAHLDAIADATDGTLKWFAADLLEEGAFAEAMAGCEVVLHTASPFLIGKIDDPQKMLVDPAVKGTANVLDSVRSAPWIRRVVLTSSVAAIFTDPVDAQNAGGKLDETHWNESASLTYQPYYFSKLAAEREAWKLAEGQSWDLVTINPAFVMGPSLTKRNDSASIDFLLALIDGRRSSGMWSMVMGWVDVREVAKAHVEAAIREDAEGRHLLCANTHDVWDVIGWLREDGPKGAKLPGMRIPKWLAYLIGPMIGYDWTFVSRNVALDFELDNTRSRERLGIEYRPVRETIRDHIAQLVADGLYDPGQ